VNDAGRRPVARRDEEVVAGIAAEPVVARAVDAEHAGPGYALHFHLEIIDCLWHDDIVDNCWVVGILRHHRTVEITTEAAGVVREVSAGAPTLDSTARQVQSDGARLTFMSLKGPEVAQPPPVPAGRYRGGRPVLPPST